jgi:hypothetical protein
MRQASKLIVSILICAGLVLAGMPTVALGGQSGADSAWDATQPPQTVAYDSLELEDRQGYSSAYIFGMTKGIMRSTLTPALKPVVLVLTIPLDIAFLPFAAIGGFFR